MEYRELKTIMNCFEESPSYGDMERVVRGALQERDAIARREGRRELFWELRTKFGAHEKLTDVIKKLRATPPDNNKARPIYSKDNNKVIRMDNNKEV